jgi:CBS domain containing-hemolysin-like protein
MDKRVQYLHVDHPLEQVLDAFYKTGTHLFIVTDDYSAFVGIITVEDVLTELLGYRISGDFDQYDSLAVVSGYRPPVPGETPDEDLTDIEAA